MSANTYVTSNYFISKWITGVMWQLIYRLSSS